MKRIFPGFGEQLCKSRVQMTGVWHSQTWLTGTVSVVLTMPHFVLGVVLGGGAAAVKDKWNTMGFHNIHSHGGRTGQEHFWKLCVTVLIVGKPLFPLAKLPVCCLFLGQTLKL